MAAAITAVAGLLISLSTSARQGALSRALTGPQAAIVFATVFVKDLDRPWLEIEWLTTPDEALISRVVPEKNGRYGMVEFACKGLTSQGGLPDCKVNEDPQGEGYKQAGEELLERFAVNPAFLAKIQGHVRFLSVQLRLSNSATDVIEGPCWPPSCIVEPSPPPPPPPR